MAFAAIPAYGHVYPLLPLALACAEAGHDVVVATGAPFLGRLPVPTCPGLPPGVTLGDAEEETQRLHPRLEGLELALALFADTTAGQVADVLVPAFEQRRPDLVVYEAMDVGAGIAATVLDIPAAAFSIGLSSAILPMLHGAAVGYHAEQWTARGATPPTRWGLLADALIDPSPPSLRSRPESLTGSYLPIRSVAYREPGALAPSWLRAPRTRPCVYVTLGTVAFGAVEVLRRTVSAVAALDVDVLVSVGPQGEPAALGEVPSHVHVERFVSQAEVLPLVDLVVHHGGTGTVLGALAAALPQLVLPQGADQFVNAETLTAIGAARALRNDEQEQDLSAIGDAVSALLGDSAERAVASRLSREIAAQPSPAEVVPRLLALA